MKSQIFSDKELIESYLIGDESCLETLVRRHKKIVFLSIMKIVRDRQVADDLFQDTFIKVINQLKLGKYKETGKFLAWVLRIAHNVTMDYYRLCGKIPVFDAGENEEFDIFDTIKSKDLNMEETIIRKQINKDVRYLIKFLPDEQKEVVFLRHYKGMAFKDIAVQADINVNTAIARMRYALKHLRKFVKDKEIILTK